MGWVSDHAWEEIVEELVNTKNGNSQEGFYHLLYEKKPIETAKTTWRERFSVIDIEKKYMQPWDHRVIFNT